ncbi:hypothetical protein Btru_034170 [Bulinus truncatus]|nr:hypothetical protein Btru_034170 [Bulinus truncatus]
MLVQSFIHPVIRKWYSAISGDPGFTDQAFKALKCFVLMVVGLNAAWRFSGYFWHGLTDAEALYEQYTDHKTFKEKTAKKRTLLEALETVEDQNHVSVTRILPSVGDSRKTFPTVFSQPVSKKLPGKQKKIKLKTSEIIFAESEEEVKQKIDEVKIKFSVESCKQYVNEVKDLLNKERYRTFSSALAKYKQEGDIHSVTPVLADLFTDSAENYYLFRKFYRFVRPKDKQYFARTCYDLTGLSCDIQLSAVDSSEVIPSVSKPIDPIVSISNDVTKQASTSSVKESTSTKTKEFRGYIPPHKNSCYMAVVDLAEDGDVSVHVKEFPDISGGKQRVLWSSDKMDCIDFKHDDRETYQELLECGAINPKDEIFTPDMFVYPKCWETTRKTFTRYPEGDTIFSTCVICDQVPVNGFRHGCGAICCFLCWKTKVFEGPPERKCPYPHCGSRISRKHLEPVKSANDISQDK